MNMNAEIQKILDDSDDPEKALATLRGDILVHMRDGSYPPGSAWAWMTIIDGHIDRLQRAKRSRRRRKNAL